MQFANDFHYWQIATLVTQKSLFTVTHALSFMSSTLIAMKYTWGAMMRTLIARFIRPTWGPSKADRNQVGPMLAPWTLLSGYLSCMLTSKLTAKRHHGQWRTANITDYKMKVRIDWLIFESRYIPIIIIYYRWNAVGIYIDYINFGITNYHPGILVIKLICETCAPTILILILAYGHMG